MQLIHRGGDGRFMLSIIEKEEKVPRKGNGFDRRIIFLPTPLFILTVNNNNSLLYSSKKLDLTE